MEFLPNYAKNNAAGGFTLELVESPVRHILLLKGASVGRFLMPRGTYQTAVFDELGVRSGCVEPLSTRKLRVFFLELHSGHSWANLPELLH